MPFVASALRDATERLALDPAAWATRELPNFSEFLTWMETTGEDARAFLLATSESIATYDTSLADVSGLFTNGPINRWMRRLPHANVDAA